LGLILVMCIISTVTWQSRASRWIHRPTCPWHPRIWRKFVWPLRLLPWMGLRNVKNTVREPLVALKPSRCVSWLCPMLDRWSNELRQRCLSRCYFGTVPSRSGDYVGGKIGMSDCMLSCKKDTSFCDLYAMCNVFGKQFECDQFSRRDQSQMHVQQQIVVHPYATVWSGMWTWSVLLLATRMWGHFPRKWLHHLWTLCLHVWWSDWYGAAIRTKNISIWWQSVFT
jgi:hypothetical protein